jgi:hypothetical protein
MRRVVWVAGAAVLLGVVGFFGLRYARAELDKADCGKGSADACFRWAVRANKAGNVTRADELVGLHCRIRLSGEEQPAFGMCVATTQARMYAHDD